MDRQRASLSFSTGEVARMSVSAELAEGVHQVEFPESFREFEELLVLASATPAAGASLALHLWIVRPKDAVIQVVAQDWFNESERDFGYEWVARVARDPCTQRIVGDGIRIGPFELDASMKRATPLRTNPF